MYWTKTPEIGGRIKRVPGDFLVEEKRDSRTWKTGYSLLEKTADFFSRFRKPKEFTYFTLVKRNWNTIDAVERIARKLGVNRTRFGYAGLKDRRALTSQRISAWKIPVSRLKNVIVKDILLKNFAYKGKKIKRGSLKGNRFTIKISNVKKNSRKIMKDFMKYKKLPNSFGEQRFGGNELIGKLLLAGNEDKAIEEINKTLYKKVGPKLDKWEQKVFKEK